MTWAAVTKSLLTTTYTDLKKEMDILLKPIRFLDDLEGRFDEKQALPYMRWFWPSCFLFSAIYVVVIFGGTYLMRNRERWDLQRALCMWNTGLAAFSFVALIRIIPWEWNRYQQGGITFINCDLTYLSGSGGNGLWAFMFMFSKLPELGDTIFIVLRKGHISFLHWYHHISVMCFTWWSYAYPIGPGVMFGTVNYFVHAIMYAYYAYRASGRNLPRWIARCITTLQLSQMFLGIYWNYLGVNELMKGNMCAMDYLNVKVAIAMYLSYAILFSNFYYWTYIKKKPKGGSIKSSKESESLAAVSSNGHKVMQNGMLPQNGYVKHRTINH